MAILVVYTRGKGEMLQVKENIANTCGYLWNEIANQCVSLFLQYLERGIKEYKPIFPINNMGGKKSLLSYILYQ